MKPVEEFMQEISGEGIDTLLLLREMTELVAFYRRLLERFELDTLTGLPGSNKFHDYTEIVKKQTNPIGVIFFDVNDLKYYNDNKGHDAGDILLQKASESIHSICKGNVKAFRTGGDEFVAVVTNCGETTLDEVLAQWREKLDELNAKNDGIHCSVAVGAAMGESGSTFDDTLKLADERMYEDKRRIKEKKS